MSQFSFKRSEKLKSRKRIQQLFQEGDSFTAYPLRIFWLPLDPGAETTQAGFSVPKRAFPRAVDRNRLKRQLREAYRLQKPTFHEALNGPVAFMIVYTNRQALTYDQIERGMRKALRRLEERMHATTNPGSDLNTPL